MPRTDPISSFSWLDYDEREAQQFRELVATLDEQETVDSLGLGSIRDTISDILFPGTSTIQTRARYFVLVPWAAQVVERRKPRDAKQFDNWLRQVELATLGSLIATTRPNQGVIGFRARNRVERLPSGVYWGGLGTWQIRLADLSLPAYRQRVVTRATRRPLLLDDEDGEVKTDTVWDELPTPPDGFPDEPLSIYPSRAEAQYLLAKMSALCAAPTSMLLHARRERSLLAIIAADKSLTGLQEPWALRAPTVTPYVEDVLRHADAFSTVLQGARLLYIRLLCEAAGGAFPGTEAALEQREQTWVVDVARRLGTFNTWARSLDDFFDLLAAAGGRQKPGTQRFVRQWAAAASRDPRGALNSHPLRDAIRVREATLKPGAARLTNQSALSNWKGAIFGGRYMDFRWGTASRHLEDCWTALGRSRARP